MKTFGGTVLFLDRSDINTDEIIPAKYLNESNRQDLRPFLLEDLKLPRFDRARHLAGRAAIVARSNFGCGSSREHAPWALEANGINIVIAESFARIFRQNMYNCGLIACALASNEIDELFHAFADKETRLEVDTRARTFAFSATDGTEKTLPFTLGGFERALVEAGGWVDYAAARYS